MTTSIIKPQWSPLTIALMVLGFIFFWPLGLGVLAYILWGEYFGGSREQAEAWVDRQRSKWRDMKSRKHGRRHSHFRTGNAAFDSYRESEMKRLDEERRRLEEERQEFEDFLRNLHAARDREEFDRFMAERERRHHNDPNGEHSNGHDDDRRDEDRRDRD